MRPYDLMRRMLATPTAWTPAALAPKLWFDDQSGVTDAGSGTCSQWDDRSGNGWHFTQSDSVGRPLIVPASLNGKRVLRFNGTSNRLSGPTGARSIFSGATAAWMAVVVKKTQNDASPTSRRLFVATDNAERARVGLYADDGTAGSANRINYGGRRLDGGTYQAVRATQSVYDQWVMILGITNYTARTVELYRDGSLDASMASAFDAAGSISPSPSSTIDIGAAPIGNTAFGGDLAFAMAGTSILSTDDIDKLFGHLAHRYGLAGSLPIGHPYKAGPP